MLESKHIAISGTTKGLGLELSRLYSKNKYSIVDINRYNDLDVTKEYSIKILFDEIPKYEYPEILINNAGICNIGSILDSNLEESKKMFDVNFWGMVNCSKYYSKNCIKNNIKGKIVNIASTAGTGIRPGRSMYASSKSAVINYSMSIAEELKIFDIKVYCIAPGAFDSSLRRNLKLDEDYSKMKTSKQVAEIVKNIIDNDFLDNQIIYIK